MASLPLGVNILNQASLPIGGPATRQAERADTDGNYHAVCRSGMRVGKRENGCITDLEGICLNSACYAPLADVSCTVAAILDHIRPKLQALPSCPTVRARACSRVRSPGRSTAKPERPNIRGTFRVNAGSLAYGYSKLSSSCAFDSRERERDGGEAEEGSEGSQSIINYLTFFSPTDN